MTRRCRGITRDARLCKNAALPGEEYCNVHIRQYRNSQNIQVVREHQH